MSGTILEADGPIHAATVTLEREGVDRVVVGSGQDGRFNVTSLTPGPYVMTVRRIGYADLRYTMTMEPGEHIALRLVMEPAAVELPGIDVEAGRSRARARFERAAGVTVRELTATDINRLPGVAEPDPLRAVSVLPGVVSTSDLSSAFNVRGGSTDQNLILLDGAPIFSPFHLGGLFSVFNADMVERAELASGGFPAEYGGRVSSVLTVTSDPGDGSFAADAAVSFLSTRLSLSGGLGEWMRLRVSGRRSYFDQILRPFLEFPYHLSDLQGVLELAPSDEDRIRVSAYSGQDILDLTRLDENDFPLRADWRWGNDVAGLSWVRDMGTVGWETTASWSRYHSGLVFPDFDDTEFRSDVSQYRLRSALTWRVSRWLELGTGSSFDRMEYDRLSHTGGTDVHRGSGEGDLRGGYLQASWGVPARWLIETGVRADRWNADVGRPAIEISPRLSAKRFFNGGTWAVKGSVGRYVQFLHSLRDEQLPLGLDTWILSDAHIPYVLSDQAQAGIELYPNDEWTVDLEGYFRDLEGVAAFNAGDNPNTAADDVLTGMGTSWGVDLMVRRDAPGVNGWLAVSFLKADRSFPDPTVSERPQPWVTYPPVFDRRVDVDLVLQFPAPMGWTGGLRFNVGTGIPFTRPIGSYAEYQAPFLRLGGRFNWTGDHEGSQDNLSGYAVLLEERNRSRYPTYHRLDLSFRRDIERSWGTITPHVDLLNVYNQQNVLFYFYEYDRNPPVRSGLSMFPMVPTIGVEVSFR